MMPIPLDRFENVPKDVFNLILQDKCLHAERDPLPVLERVSWEWRRLVQEWAVPAFDNCPLYSTPKVELLSPALRILNLKGVQRILKPNLEAIASKCTGIEKLTLFDINFEIGDTLNSLRLKTLKIEDTPELIDFTFLMAQTQLERLDFKDVWIGRFPQAFRMDCPLRKFTWINSRVWRLHATKLPESIESICLSNCYIGERALFKSLTNLRSLDITLGEAPKLYPQMTALKDLKFKHVSLGSGDYFDRAPLQLTKLSIQSTTPIPSLTRFIHLSELELGPGTFESNTLNADIQLEKLTLHMMTRKRMHKLFSQVSPTLTELNLVHCIFKSSDLTKFTNLRLNSI